MATGKGYVSDEGHDKLDEATGGSVSNDDLKLLSAIHALGITGFF